MPNHAISSLSTFRISRCAIPPSHEITRSDMLIALFFICITTIPFYRNNGNILVTCFTSSLNCIVYILPIVFVELIYGAFSQGSVLKAYSFNAIGLVVMVIVTVTDFQYILAALLDTHSVIWTVIAFLTEDSNPRSSLWTCNNPWNSEKCCDLVRHLNDTSKRTMYLKRDCNTPLEDFYLQTGKYRVTWITRVVMHRAIDSGQSSLILWMVMTVCVIGLCHLSFRTGLRLVTVSAGLPSTLFFCFFFAHIFYMPFTSSQFIHAVTPATKYTSEYGFAIAFPNMYSVNHIICSCGILLVMESSVKAEKTERFIGRVFKCSIVIFFVTVVFKALAIFARHGLMDLKSFTRQFDTGLDRSTQVTTVRIVFADQHDWLYMNLLDYIELVHTLRAKLNIVNPLFVLENAALLFPIWNGFAYIGFRLVVFKVRLERLCRDCGLDVTDNKNGSWQLLTKMAMPLCLMSIVMSCDEDTFRAFLHPFETFCMALQMFMLAGFLFCILRVFVASVGARRHEFRRMYRFVMAHWSGYVVLAIVLKSLLVCIKIWYTLNEVRKHFKTRKVVVFQKRVLYFYQYTVRVLGRPALRVFGYGGPTRDWTLNDIYGGTSVGLMCLIVLLLTDAIRWLLNMKKRLIKSIKFPAVFYLHYCWEYYMFILFRIYSRRRRLDKSKMQIQIGTDD